MTLRQLLPVLAAGIVCGCTTAGPGPWGVTGELAHEPAGSSHWQVVRVQEGDTLFAIARRYNATISSLIAANQLNGETIYAGQHLTVP